MYCIFMQCIVCHLHVFSTGLVSYLFLILDSLSRTGPREASDAARRAPRCHRDVMASVPA